MTNDPLSREWRWRQDAATGKSTPLSVGEWIRFLVRIIAIMLLLLAMIPLHYIWRIFAYGSPIPMLFLRWTGWIVGARVDRRGVPLRRDVFFIANHVSWVDILTVAGASGTAFVAKYELSQVPVIGWLCRLNRTVFVKRENRMGVADQINQLREALMDNWSVTVFSRGHDDRRPFLAAVQIEHAQRAGTTAARCHGSADRA